MSNQKKILVIVEGEKTEQQFFKSLESAFSFNFTICCFRANIFTLYSKLEELDFNADIKQVLIEMHPEYKETLSDKFAYTYLIFDFDAHHPKREDVRSLEEIISSNMEKVKSMAAFFTDETDSTIGRLYINYPMMESFRDCDAPFDANYQDEFVSLPNLKDFKNHAGTKQMATKRIDSYNSFDFKLLTKMNVYKLSLIALHYWGDMTYNQYLENSNATTILEKQAAIIAQNKQVAVLNTSLFLLIDYFGNQKGFYNFIMK